jgi:hypothetical protein
MHLETTVHDAHLAKFGLLIPVVLLFCLFVGLAVLAVVLLFSRSKRRAGLALFVALGCCVMLATMVLVPAIAYHRMRIRNVYVATERAEAMLRADAAAMHAEHQHDRPPVDLSGFGVTPPGVIPLDEAMNEAINAEPADAAARASAGAVPPAAVHEDAAHEDAAHDDAVHDEAVHDEAVHDEAVHDEAAAHDDVVPNATASGEAASRADDHAEAGHEATVTDEAVDFAAAADAAASGAGNSHAATDAAGEASRGEPISRDGRAGEREPAPEWIEQPPMRMGQVHSEVVSAGPYTTAEECYAAFDRALRTATDKYVEWLITQHFPGGMPGFELQRGEMLARVDLHRLEIAPPPIERIPLYLQGRQYQVGYMYSLHGRVEFDADFREAVARHVRERASMERLATTGWVSAGMLGGVAMLFSFFRFRAGRMTV